MFASARWRSRRCRTHTNSSRSGVGAGVVRLCGRGAERLRRELRQPSHDPARSLPSPACHPEPAPTRSVLPGAPRRHGLLGTSAEDGVPGGGVLKGRNRKDEPRHESQRDAALAQQRAPAAGPGFAVVGRGESRHAQDVPEHMQHDRRYPGSTCIVLPPRRYRTRLPTGSRKLVRNGRAGKARCGLTLRQVSAGQPRLRRERCGRPGRALRGRHRRRIDRSRHVTGGPVGPPVTMLDSTSVSRAVRRPSARGRRARAARPACRGVR